MEQKLEKEVKELIKHITNFSYWAQSMDYWTSHAEEDAVSFLEQGIELAKKYGVEKAKEIMAHVKKEIA